MMECYISPLLEALPHQNHIQADLIVSTLPYLGT